MDGAWILGLTLAGVVGVVLAVAVWSARAVSCCHWARSGSWLVRTYVRPPNAPVFDVEEGRFDAYARRRLGTIGDTVEVRTRSGVAYSAPRDSGETSVVNSGTAGPSSSGMAGVPDAREALFVAAPEAALTGILVFDTLRSAAQLDSSLLDAMTQLSGEQIDGLADFRNFQAMDGYQLDSIKLRGTVGEQESAEGFEGLGHDVSWPDGGLTEFGPSNNPGWDLSVDGQEVNVKVAADASEAASEHFAKYPDIPVVVNSDAANIPDDAVYVDADNALQPDDLIGDNIVVVQEALTLSGAEGIQAAGSDAADAIDLDAAADVVPGLGLLIAGVRSGVREGRLLANGKTEAGRAIKNIAVDTAGRGGGGLTGLAAGAKTGAVIDAAMGGAGLGIPTAICSTGGTLLGAYAGGKGANAVKGRPLKDAQTSLADKLKGLNAEVAKVHAEAENKVETGCAREDARHGSTCREIQQAYLDLLSGLRADLTRSSHLTLVEARSMLAVAAGAVAAAEAEYCDLADRRGLRRRLSTRRAKAVSSAEAWRRAADASLGRLTSESDARAAVMDVVMAAPGGECAAGEVVTTFLAAQRRVRGEALAGNALMLDLLRASRLQALRALEQLREEAQSTAERRLQPSLESVTKAKGKVWRELERAGKR